MKKTGTNYFLPLVAVTDGIASVRVKVKGIHRESPWCAPGTLLIQCRLHKTKKHTVTRTRRLGPGPAWRRRRRAPRRQSCPHRVCKACHRAAAPWTTPSWTG